MDTRPTSQEIRAALESVKASVSFKKADKGLAILEYLVERHFENAPKEAFSEMSIGLFVYGDDYDPLPSSKVRSAIGRLRPALDAFYRKEGKENPVRITIGTDYYMPEFRYATQELAISAPQEQPAPISRAFDKRAAYILKVTVFVDELLHMLDRSCPTKWWVTKLGILTAKPGTPIYMPQHTRFSIQLTPDVDGFIREVSALASAHDQGVPDDWRSIRAYLLVMPCDIKLPEEPFFTTDAAIAKYRRQVSSIIDGAVASSANQIRSRRDKILNSIIAASL